MGRNTFLRFIGLQHGPVPGSAGSAVVTDDKGIILGFPVANRAGRAPVTAEQSGLNRLHSSSWERAAGRKENQEKRHLVTGVRGCPSAQGGRAVPAPLTSGG